MGCCQSDSKDEKGITMVDDCITNIFRSMKRKNVPVAVFVASEDHRDEFIRLVTQRLESAGFDTDGFHAEGPSDICKFATGSILKVIVASGDMKCDSRDFTNTWIQNIIEKREDFEAIYAKYLSHMLMTDGMQKFKM